MVILFFWIIIVLLCNGVLGINILVSSFWDMFEFIGILVFI